MKGTVLSGSEEESHKQMKEIMLSGCEEGSETMISAETVLDSKTEYDWKIQHLGTTKKLEDRFNRRYILNL